MSGGSYHEPGVTKKESGGYSIPAAGNLGTIATNTDNL